MEIIVSNPKPSVFFKDISTGTGFKWREWYYMKIEECTVERMFGKKTANAVSFENGMLAHFDPTEKVYLIPTCVHVDA